MTAIANPNLLSPRGTKYFGWSKVCRLEVSVANAVAVSLPPT